MSKRIIKKKYKWLELRPNSTKIVMEQTKRNFQNLWNTTCSIEFRSAQKRADLNAFNLLTNLISVIVCRFKFSLGNLECPTIPSPNFAETS